MVFFMASIHRLESAASSMRGQPRESFAGCRRQLIPPGKFAGHGPMFTVSVMCKSTMVNCFTTFSGLKPVEVGKLPRRSIVSAVNRIDDKKPFAPVVEHMVGTDLPTVMYHDNSVEVVQNEKSRKVEPCTPERGRNPRIKIKVSWGRRIVGDHRRTIIVIIVVDNCRADIPAGIRRRLACSVIAPCDGNDDIQAEVIGNGLQSCHGCRHTHLQLARFYRGLN